jgi:hypothetical protein
VKDNFLPKQGHQVASSYSDKIVLRHCNLISTVKNLILILQLSVSTRRLFVWTAVVAIHRDKKKFVEVIKIGMN